MDGLDRQLLDLMESGPKQGVPKPAIAAIGKGLAEIASDLGELRFYLLQDAEGGWWNPPIDGPHGTVTESWLVAFHDRQAAEAMRDRLNPLANSNTAPDRDLSFQIIEMEVLPLLMLGMGLRDSAGLAFSRQGSPPSSSGMPPIVPERFVRSSKLQQVMKTALIKFKATQRSRSSFA